ncbi:MAG: hypothetical protein H6Q10_3057 [Acidobacteria bacterium]|nr:hypothetical protein [Acidobacteriota bacterium]
MAGEQPRDLPFAPNFRVGDWLVEPSLDRLSRNGSVVHLRPQLTNLLLLLARHAGRTVSKGQILASVWAGQFVAESGLSRCMTELRRALEDDAREPKVVETITKRGYRLVAPVVFLDEAALKGGVRAPSSGGRPVDAPRRAVGTGLAATEAILGTLEAGVARIRSWVVQRRASLGREASPIVRPSAP